MVLIDTSNQIGKEFTLYGKEEVQNTKKEILELMDGHDNPVFHITMNDINHEDVVS